MDNDKIIVICGNSACVDKDTEYFNGKGWKKISEYNEGDMVLQYSEGGLAELVYPQNYIKNKCDKLWLIESKGVNQCLTDDHSVYYYLPNKKKLKLYHKPFKEVKNDYDKNIGGFVGKFITTFNYDGKGIDLSDNEIRLMCAIICDASFIKDSDKCFFNLKKDRKKEELRRLLNDMKYEWIEKEYPSMPNYTRFILKAPRIEKHFSDYWYGCSQKQLQIICDNIMQWDGYENKRSPKNKIISKRFSTTIKETADFIQFCFSACGYRATLSISDRRGRIRVLNGKEYITKSIDYDVITSNKRGTRDTLVGLVKSEDYENKIKEYKSLDGFSYCFTVPSGILVLRREGKIFITGNCGKDSISRLLEQRDGYNFIVSTTTRPMRVGESDRNPYNFVTNDYFNKLIENNELIEHREYNTLVNNVPAKWFYGIEKKEMEEGKPYVVVLDTVGLSEMKRQFGSRVVSILIEVDDDIRLERAKLRGSFDITEWNRRLEDDRRIFSTQEFKNDIDFTVTNNTNNVEDCYNKIKEILRGI